jgi:hypothetical protein
MISAPPPPYVIMHMPKHFFSHFFFDRHKLINMSIVQSDPLLQVETTCGTLLYELQVYFFFKIKRNFIHNLPF